MTGSAIGGLLRVLRLDVDLEDCHLDGLLPLLPLIEHEGAARWIVRRAHQAPGARRSALIDGLRGMVRAEVPLAARQQEELRRVLGLLSEAELPCVLIKGAARMVWAPEVPYLDARSTQDIDLLIAPGLAQPAWELLRTRGYTVIAEALPGHHHLPVLAGELRVAIELHSALSRQITPETSWARATEPSVVRSWNGLDVRVPPLAELAWHALSHALSDGADAYRLKNLLPLAAVFRAGAATPTSWPGRAAVELVDSRTGAVPDPAAVDRWVGAAQWLAGKGSGPPSGLRALLAWKAAVFRARPWLGRALAERAVIEAARSELGYPPEPGWPGDALVARVRRRSAAALSRGSYRAMRFVGPGLAGRPSFP